MTLVEPIIIFVFGFRISTRLCEAFLAAELKKRSVRQFFSGACEVSRNDDFINWALSRKSSTNVERITCNQNCIIASSIAQSAGVGTGYNRVTNILLFLAG